jgi:hypothetical protein
MDAAAILALVEKGISVASSLIVAGQSAAPAWAALTNLFNKKTGEITQADLDATEAVLDEQIAKFNAPLPPDA